MRHGVALLLAVRRFRPPKFGSALKQPCNGALSIKKRPPHCAPGILRARPNLVEFGPSFGRPGVSQSDHVFAITG